MVRAAKFDFSDDAGNGVEAVKGKVGKSDKNAGSKTGGAINPADAFGATGKINGSEPGTTGATGTTGTTGEEPGKRKRGRPKGSRNKTSGQTRRAGPQEKATLTKTLSTGIYALHVTLAAGFKAPEFQLSKAESDEIAKCVADVQSAYGVNIDPKTQALANLGAALAGSYIPRGAAFMARKKLESKAATKGQQQPQQQPQPQPQAKAPEPQQQPQRKSNVSNIRPDIKDAEQALTPAQLFGFGFSGE